MITRLPLRAILLAVALLSFSAGAARAQDAAPTLQPAQATLEAGLVEQLGTVTGQVVNGTTAASVPAGFEVTLHSFDAHGSSPAASTTLTTTTTTGGAFLFEEVPFSASRQFVIAAVYGQATYTSGVLAFAPGEGVLDASLEIFESTSDASALQIDQVHTYLEFSTPGAVTVGQLYVFSNRGDTAYGADGASRLRFNLPAGAAGVSVQNAVEGQNLFAVEGGFELAQPVIPGERSTQVLVSFDLPYAGAADYAQTMVYPVSSLNVLITDLGVSLSDSALTSLGVQNAMGMQFQGFEQTGLSAGDSLRFHLSGLPTTVTGAETAVAPAAVERPWPLVAGLAGVGAGLLIAGGWLYWRSRGQPAVQPPLSRDDLLRALAELDERHDAQQVSDLAYTRARDRIKQQLREQWS